MLDSATIAPSHLISFAYVDVRHPSPSFYCSAACAFLGGSVYSATRTRPFVMSLVSFMLFGSLLYRPHSVLLGIYISDVFYNGNELRIMC